MIKQPKKKEKKCVKPEIVTLGPPPKQGCPQGQVWNGNKCVDDVG